MTETARIEPSCSICGETAATIVLSKNDGDWLLTARRGADESAERISDERAALVVAAAVPPCVEERLWAAGLDEAAGFCLQCGTFYCPSHWKEGWCPRGHLMSIQPW